MGRPATAVTEIMALLEPLLEEARRKYLAQPLEQREPTLPVNEWGQPCVRELVKTLRLTKHKEQHFYKKAEIKSALNAVATEQGLKPIGTKDAEEAEDKPVADRLKQANTARSDLAKTLAEREAVIEQQRRLIASFREQMRLLEETGVVMRTGDIV